MHTAVSPSLTRSLVVGAWLLGAAAAPLRAQTAPSAPPRPVTTPRAHFGFDIGADYRLANYTQLERYWQTIARESDRVKVERIGTTAEGRAMWTLVISAPANIARLDHYRGVARRLARAEGLTDEQARALAREGKAVVWIDGGLHATEVLGAQQLIQTVYELLSRDDAETRRLLEDNIILCTLVNPDGMELVSDWYNRTGDTLKRSTSGIPRLYQKYVGHDNNRDFYMATQPETQAINTVLYRRWFPQIVYNHHQTGPAGTVMFAPPFRDPFNYTYDPLVVMQLDQVGSAMHARFAAEGKPGVTMRSGANYSTWWNGGLRTMPYFHNQVGLLTETIGNPTPIRIPLIPANQLARADLPYPIAPQRWHFRQSVDYSLTANRAVLDFASRYRETLLYNAYRMGKNAIERGSRDTWTVIPDAVAALVDSAQRAAGPERAGAAEEPRAPLTPAGRPVDATYQAMLRRPAERNPRGYVIPRDQADFLTATKFVNALIRGGVDVDRATREFSVAGRRYPAGSYVVRTAQAFRPHVLDMFEPQDHPTDLQYPGGPPRPPYDNAGWTLAYQMGVRFDRVLDAFDAPTERLPDEAKPPAGTVARSSGGWLLSHATNDAFIALNRLHKAGSPVYWLDRPLSANGKLYPAGTFYVAPGGRALGIVQKLAADVGLSFDAAPERAPAGATRLAPVRLGLWDQYGGSMPSGWTRWLLEQYEFPYEVVYPQELDRGNLARRFDALVFVGGAIPLADRAAARGDDDESNGQPKPADIPAALRARLGGVTVASTVPQIKRFIEGGGTVLTVGSSANLAQHLGLPVESQLVEIVNGEQRPLPRTKFYVPGSLLAMRVDTTARLGAGVGHQGRVDVVYNNNPVFRLRPDAAARGVRAVAWFDGPKPLRSGWALGERYLDQGVQVVDAPYGRGRVFLFAPEVTFRAQPHGTFKLLFNGIVLSRPAAGGGDATVAPATEAGGR